MTFIRGNDVVVIPSEGVARVSEIKIGGSRDLTVNAVSTEGDKVFVTTFTNAAYGEVTGLPNESESLNELYIVSRPVAEALKDRRVDIVVPGTLIRDKKGAVIGCGSLIMIS